MDRLSTLPDHVLVRILLKVGTKQAVRTSGLSRQWSRVWTQLPILSFEGIDSTIPTDALAAYKAHGEVDIKSLAVSTNQMDAEQTTAWLSLAAPLLSGWLHFNNSYALSRESLRLFLNDAEDAVVRRHALELPCFKKATEMMMDLGFLGLALPPAGTFDALRVIWLQHFWFRGQLSISNTVFPSLQELTVRTVRGMAVLKLNSKSLLSIHVSVLPELQRLKISAPALKKLEVTHCFYDVRGPIATIAAERLEEIRWEVPCVPDFSEIPHPRLLRVPAICTHWSEGICAKFMNLFPSVDHLGLQINLQLRKNGSMLSMKDISIRNVNTLWLCLEANGHSFQERLLKLLTNCSGIRHLNLSFQVQDEYLLSWQVQGVCSPGCICRNEPVIWGPEVVPVRALKSVEVVNFHGSPSEIQFLKQLVLRAPNLKLLRITTKVEEQSMDSIEEIIPAECLFQINLDIRADNQFIYPDVNAVGAAAAVEEQVL